MIEERDQELAKFHADLFKKVVELNSNHLPTRDNDKLSLSDEELIKRASAAENGLKFQRLWTGRWREAGYSSQSEADLTLCNILSFWTGKDPEKIDSVFRQSGLMRPKWDEPRGKTTYGQLTIQKATLSNLPTYSELRTLGKTPPNHIIEPQAPADSESGSANPAISPSDLGNAERLIAKHGQDLHYCYLWNKWLYWDGTKWVKDDIGEVYRRAKDTVRTIYAEASRTLDEKHRKEIGKHALKSENDLRIKAMINQAQSEPGIPVTPDQLDRDPWLLNVLNGTIYLKTGELLPHNRDHLITKKAPVEYSLIATCPEWEKFLYRDHRWERKLTVLFTAGGGVCLDRRHPGAGDVFSLRNRRQRQKHLSGHHWQNVGRLCPANPHGNTYGKAERLHTERCGQAEGRPFRGRGRGGGGETAGGKHGETVDRR